MKPVLVAATALLMLAIVTCLLLGTIGWFAIGFGVMTDCTDTYSSSTTFRSPCATTGLWINAGALAQQLLAATGVGVLVRGVRTERSRLLATGGAVILLSSVLLVVGTTWRAEGSLCQPGSRATCTSDAAAAVPAPTRSER